VLEQSANSAWSDYFNSTIKNLNSGPAPSLGQLTSELAKADHTAFAVLVELECLSDLQGCLQYLWAFMLILMD